MISSTTSSVFTAESPLRCVAFIVHSISDYLLFLQNAFSNRLLPFGVNFYSMLVVDLLHEFELSVWKAILTHLIRILYAKGEDAVGLMNSRSVITTPACFSLTGGLKVSQSPFIWADNHSRAIFRCICDETTRST